MARQKPTKEDFLKEIDYYERQIITDPGGKSLYESMIELAKKKLKEYDN